MDRLGLDNFSKLLMKGHVLHCVLAHLKVPGCSLVLNADEGPKLEMSASESLYGGQFTLSTQLIKPNYLVIVPPTQQHSFFRNLPHLKLGNTSNSKD